MKSEGIVREVIIGVIFSELIENASSTARRPSGGACRTVKNKTCPQKYKEVYKEALKELETVDENVSEDDYMGWGTEPVGDPITVLRRLCCPINSERTKTEEKKALGCQLTSCMDAFQFTTYGDDLCSSITRWVRGKKLEYEEAARDQCALEYEDGTSGIGVKAVCCPKNSNRGLLPVRKRNRC